MRATLTEFRVGEIRLFLKQTAETNVGLSLHRKKARLRSLADL
jgi:hypothetical protein